MKNKCKGEYIMKKIVLKTIWRFLLTLLITAIMLSMAQFTPALAIPNNDGETAYSTVFSKLADPATNNAVHYLLPSTLEYKQS